MTCSSSFYWKKDSIFFISKGYKFIDWLQLRIKRDLFATKGETRTRYSRVSVRMEVLKKAKVALRLVNLASKNGVYLSKWRIPNAIIDLLLLLPMSICTVQMVIFCFKTGPSLKEISSSIYLILGISSILAFYICLAANNDLIIATLDHLQEMVTLSKMKGNR